MYLPWNRLRWRRRKISSWFPLAQCSWWSFRQALRSSQLCLSSTPVTLHGAVQTQCVRFSLLAPPTLQKRELSSLSVELDIICNDFDLAYRVSPGNLEPLWEVVERVRLGANGVLGPRHLGEKPRGSVYAQFADVHVSVGSTHWPPLVISLH